jgi:hypothetical protein
VHWVEALVGELQQQAGLAHACARRARASGAATSARATGASVSGARASEVRARNPT